MLSIQLVVMADLQMKNTQGQIGVELSTNPFSIHNQDTNLGLSNSRIHLGPTEQTHFQTDNPNHHQI